MRQAGLVAQAVALLGGVLAGFRAKQADAGVLTFPSLHPQYSYGFRLIEPGGTPVVCKRVWGCGPGSRRRTWRTSPIIQASMSLPAVRQAIIGRLFAPLNGPVEGQVNHIKLIKRSMYGRAKFDLLRQRVLHGA